MVVKKSIGTQANEILTKRRTDGERTQNAHRQDILHRIPEIGKLQDEKDRYQFLAMRLSVSGRKNECEPLYRKFATADQNIKELLVQNGYPKDYMERKYVCPICQDRGFVRETGKPCECLKNLQHEIRIANYHKSNYDNDASFESSDLSLFSDEVDPTWKISPRQLHIAASKKLIKFCEDRKAALTNPKIPPENFLLTGKPGTSKSYLSSCVIKRLDEYGIPTLYVSAPALVDAIFEDMDNKNTDQRGANREEFVNADILILDDLGTESPTEYVTKMISEIIAERLLKNKSTIISTNLTFKLIGKSYPERLQSRLSAFTQIPCFGPDLRVIIAKRKKDMIS